MQPDLIPATASPRSAEPFVSWLTSLFDGRWWVEVTGADECFDPLAVIVEGERFTQAQADAIKARGTTSYNARRKARLIGEAESLRKIIATWDGSRVSTDGRRIIIDLSAR